MIPSLSAGRSVGVAGDRCGLKQVVTSRSHSWIEQLLQSWRKIRYHASWRYSYSYLQFGREKGDTQSSWCWDVREVMELMEGTHAVSGVTSTRFNEGQPAVFVIKFRSVLVTTVSIVVFSFVFCIIWTLKYNQVSQLCNWCALLLAGHEQRIITFLSLLKQIKMTYRVESVEILCRFCHGQGNKNEEQPRSDRSFVHLIFGSSVELRVDVPFPLFTFCKLRTLEP